MDWKVQEYTDNIANLETELQEPHEYKVIFLNDDYTTMDFVVAMLVTVFHKDDKLRLAINVAGLCCFEERGSVIGVDGEDDSLSLAIRDGGGGEYGDMMAGN